MLCYVMYACLSVSMSMSTCMCIYMYVYVYVYVYMYICTRNCICICRASRIWKVVWQLFNPLPNQLLLLIVSRFPCTPCGFRPTHLPTELPEKKDICHQWKPTLGQWASSSNQGEFWDQDSTQKTTQKTIQGIQGIQESKRRKAQLTPVVSTEMAKCRCSTLERVQRWALPAMQLHCPIPRGGPLMKLSSDHYNINWH